MLKQRRIIFILAALTALSVFISACGASTGGTTTNTVTPTAAAVKPTCTTGSLQATGSTALQQLATDVANDYQKQCSGANITVGGGGSSTGLKNVSDGSSQVGNSDVFASATKYPGLIDHKVAVVVFSVVVNSKVTGVTNLTSAQLKDIYSGKTTNWKDLGGNDLKIVPVSRPTGSGTRLTFEQYVLAQKESLNGSNPIASTSGDVANTVGQTDGAVSYVATDFAKKNSLNVITIDGVADTDANVQSNTYKFWNLEHMYTKGDATGLAKDYIDYISGKGADSFRKTDGFLNISTMAADAITAKTPKS